MPGIYELCVTEGWPSKVASNRPDNSYATKDLFEKHPTTPNAWRFYARLDDTLVLENGENANPLMIEGVARKNPNIAEAIAFGATKPRIGLFIIPSEKSPFDNDKELLDAVFPDIDKCNAESPAYAYVSRGMIFVLPKYSQYRKIDKGTVIRAAFYKDFAQQITDIYESADAAAGDQVLEGEELIEFLRRELLEITPAIQPSSLEPERYLFSLGIDSLQSIRLRTAILGTLDLGGQKLSQNFVFEDPLLKAMANELTHLRLGNGPKTQIPVEERMQSLIDKYSGGFKTHISIPRVADGQHMVLTGATGSLGAHIAAPLVQSDDVRKVYCLVRANSVNSTRRRVAQSLHTRNVTLALTTAAEGR